MTNFDNRIAASRRIFLGVASYGFGWVWILGFNRKVSHNVRLHILNFRYINSIFDTEVRMASQREREKYARAIFVAAEGAL